MTQEKPDDFSQAPLYRTIVGEDDAGMAVLSGPFRAWRMGGHLVTEAGESLPALLMMKQGVRCGPDGEPIVPLSTPLGLQALFLARFERADPEADLAQHAADIEILRAGVQARRAPAPLDCDLVLLGIEKETDVSAREWTLAPLAPGSPFHLMTAIAGRMLAGRDGWKPSFQDLRVLNLKPAFADKAEELVAWMQATGTARALEPCSHPGMGYETGIPVIALKDGIAALHFPDRHGFWTLAWVAEPELVDRLAALPEAEPGPQGAPKP